MDQQQRRQIDEAAEQFADAVIEAYRAVAERGVSGNRLNAELAQSFFDGAINSLRAQAQSNRNASQELSTQQQRQAEAAQALVRESVATYMDFVNSLFYYYQDNLQRARRQARQP